jgi:hypothetical protein
MSDIVERLRNELGWGIGPALLCQTAADEIERLREVLRSIEENKHQFSMGDLPKCCNKTVIAHCEGCPYIPAARCTCFRCLPHMKSPDAAAIARAALAKGENDDTD